MCTAVSYRTKDHYFGRNLDLDCSYDERVAIIPRNYPLTFLRARRIERHYAMIGVAHMEGDAPLYYDAVNEKGLAIAGLNFPGWATYSPEQPGMDNITPYELPWWLLGQCATLEQARQLLGRLNFLRESAFSHLPLPTLHWMISDRTGSIVVEPMAEGVRVYENPVEVLTNSPSFHYQQIYLSNYMGVSAQPPVNRFCADLELKPYSFGFGGMGLPGDLSSGSRFVRAAFTRLNSVSGDGEMESVSQVFHILSSVAQIRGSVCLEQGKYETTLYTCCCNTDTGVYYYTTYENSQLTAVDLHREDLEGRTTVSYPVEKENRIHWQN